MRTRETSPDTKMTCDGEAYVKLLYKLLSLHDEIKIQNDLFNTTDVDISLDKMEQLILDALEDEVGTR